MYKSMSYSSLAEMFYRTVEKFPDKTGMMHKRNGRYEAITFRDMAVQVSNLAGVRTLGSSVAAWAQREFLRAS